MIAYNGRSFFVSPLRLLSKGEIGRKGSIIAMIKGTQADQLAEVLKKIPKRLRIQVEEVTLDMAASMNSTVGRCFPNAHRVIDRFHVQKLAFEAVQEIRIHHRWQALEDFFNNRATNAAAKSLNAKIKAFRNAMRGVRDVEFFLFRLSKIYA
jgi:transposase